MTISHHRCSCADKPLLLLGGWPQNWYAWRHLMLPLARTFTVIAVDPRGVGLSEKALDGYDSRTPKQARQRPYPVTRLISTSNNSSAIHKPCGPASTITAQSISRFHRTKSAKQRA